MPVCQATLSFYDFGQYCLAAGVVFASLISNDNTAGSAVK